MPITLKLLALVWDDAHDEAYAMFTRAKDVFGL